MPISTYSASSKRKSKGFTLLEMMVVIGVVTVLSSMILGYSQRNNRQVMLATSQAKMVSLFSRAKALSIQTFFEPQEADETICAHGVKVDEETQSIFIFQDIAEGVGCSRDIDDYEYDSGDVRLEGELNELFVGEQTIVIDGDNTDLDWVLFIPPEPRVKFNGSQQEYGVALTDGTVNVSVRVTKDGQIKLN